MNFFWTPSFEQMPTQWAPAHLKINPSTLKKGISPLSLKNEAHFWEFIPRKKATPKNCHYYLFHFFICYLAAPWPIFGHHWGESFTHPKLITAFLSIFNQKVTKSLVMSPFSSIDSELTLVIRSYEAFFQMQFECENITFLLFHGYSKKWRVLKMDFNTMLHTFQRLATLREV